MVDIHSHLLPAVDDGAKNMEESIELLSLEVLNGVDRVFVTPHFNPERDSLEEFFSRRESALAGLKHEAALKNIEIGLIPGAEVYFSPELAQIDLDGLCLGCSKYILVEFPFSVYPILANQVFYQLMQKGKTPIIAHIERYGYFAGGNIEALYSLVESGCLTQINADSVADRDNFRFIKKCLEHNLTHFIASDAHSPSKRPPKIKKAMDYLKKKYPDFAENAVSNANAITENRPVEAEPAT